MTIIAAVDLNSQIWVGSDTESNYNDRLHPSGPKWVRSPDRRSALGHSGDSLARQIVERNIRKLKWGKPPGEMALSLAKLCDQSGFLKPVFEAGEATGNYKQNWLYAWSSGTAYIDCSFCFLPGGAWAAEGSGKEYALGAAFEAEGTPREILSRMLRAAIALDLYCGGEPWIRRIR